MGISLRVAKNTTLSPKNGKVIPRIHVLNAVHLNIDVKCRDFKGILSRPRGLMDKASDLGSEDSRFESWRGRYVASFYF